MYQPRFRNRNQLHKYPGAVVQDYYPNPATAWPPSWNTFYSGPELIIQDVVDYIDDIAGDPPRKSQGLGGYRFHPMTKVKVEFSNQGGGSVWQVQDKSLTGTAPNQYYKATRRPATGYPDAYVWSTLAPPMVGDRVNLAAMGFPSADISDLRALAETEVLAKRGKFGDSNLYESLAEADKSLRMLKDILDSARRIQDAMFRSYGRSKGRRLTNELAGLYLMTRYGFKPLVSDISAILLSLEKPLGQILRTTRSSREKISTQKTSLSDQNDSNQVIYSRSMVTESNISVRSMSLDHANITLMGALGLGIKDFVSVPWELVPYSFVVDWFANIGDFLNALVPDVSVSNLGMCTTTKWVSRSTVTYGVKGTYSSSRVLVSSNPIPPITRTVTFTERTVGAFAPQLRWQSDFKFDSLTRVLDAASLFVQRAKGIKQVMGFPSELDKIVHLRRKQSSAKGVWTPSFFHNLSDR